VFVLFKVVAATWLSENDIDSELKLEI
jgi:hypothetical protein